MFPVEANSLVKKHLSNNRYHRLKTRRTKSGFSLYYAIKSGIENPDSAIGIYAGDDESYQTFSDIFDPVIRDYHLLEKHHSHTSDFSESSLPNPDPHGKYILSTRVRIARNLESVPFPPFINLADRYRVEQAVLTVLNELCSDLDGRYFSFETMESETVSTLSKKKVLFKKGDRFQEAAGINRDYPAARGVYLSWDEKFMVWVNEEDHLRLISRQYDGDMAAVFNRLLWAADTFEKSLKFSFDPKYGYLTACPSNLGTTMRASVHMKIPSFEYIKQPLFQAAEKFHLQIRGTRGEKTPIENCVFDISNRQRLGVSENDCINILHNGISHIIGLLEK